MTYKYKDAVSHKLSHLEFNVDCVLGCGWPDKIMGHVAMRKHLVDECPSVMQLCTVCDLKETRANKDIHDCKQGLIAKVKYQ